MPKWLLELINEVLSKSRAVGVVAYLGVAIAVWGILRGVTSSLGVPPGLPRFGIEVISSLALPLVIFLLHPMRWHLIYRSLRSEVQWFRRNNARIIVGVGPGGAIIAGMVAKLMAELDGQEPEIEVIDREYSLDEYNQVQVSVDNVKKRLKLASVGVVVVTSEIHAGGTMIKVCTALRALDIDAPVFSYIWSEQAALQPRSGLDQFVIKADQRGILPWPDAPAKRHKPRKAKS